MILGHIGVRKGSKGLPEKNFRQLHGKPLLDWSLDQLLSNALIDIVVVSTDCQEMRQHSVAKGAFDIGERPANLSDDTASKWSVWQHSLMRVEELFGPVDLFVDLDCTSPLRLDNDIDDIIAMAMSKKPDMVMSCCEARKNPYFNLVEPDDQGHLRVSKTIDKQVVARQQAPLVLEHAASTYAVFPKYLKTASSLFDGDVIPYLMPADRCVDIDSQYDFDIVEFLMSRRYSS